MHRLFHALKSIAHQPAQLLLLGAVTLFSAYAWTGCASDSSVPSSPESIESTVDVSAAPDARIPDSAQRHLDQVLGIMDDLLSENPDQIAKGWERMDELQPGLYNEMMAALDRLFAASEDGGRVEIPFELTYGAEGAAVQADGDGSICTTIKITLTLTIKAGSKICRELPGPFGSIIRSCTVLDKDTVVNIPLCFEFECEPPVEGCTVTHSSTTTIEVDRHLEWEGPDTNGNGTPDSSGDVTISGSATIVVTVKTCK